MNPVTRLRALYFCLFMAMGAFQPYMTLSLARRGLTPGQVAWLMFLFPLLRILVPPLWGWLADRLGRRVAVMRGLALAAVGSAGLLALAGDFAGHLLGFVLLGVFYGPLFPLLDAVALSLLEEHGADYGRVRNLGSLGFIAGVGLGGLAFSAHGVEHAPWAFLLALAATGLALAALPSPSRPPPEGEPVGLGDLAAVLADPTMRVVLLSAFLHFVPHTGYALYFSVHCDQLGIDMAVTGLAWSLGVAAEVVLLAYAADLAKRVGLRAMVLTGIALSVVRWALVPLCHTATPLVLLQLLHGFTFGVWFYASLHLVDRVAPARLRASAQGLFGAAVFGAGVAVGGYLWGRLLPVVGSSRVFTGMALWEVLALVVALRLPCPPGAPPESASPRERRPRADTRAAAR